MKRKIVTLIMAVALTVTAAPVPASAATYLYTKVAGKNGFTMDFSGGTYGRVIEADKKNQSYWADAWYEKTLFVKRDAVRGWHKDYKFGLLVKNSKKETSSDDFDKTSKEKKVSIKHTGDWVQYEFYVYK